MAEHTDISWADGTLNFWIGCTEVSLGEKGACVNCYARTWANRFPNYRGTWGAGAPRVKTTGALAKAMKMERIALEHGRPFFCFSNSLADIFDAEVPIEWLVEAFEIMRKTPHVIYLLLTKRGNFIKRIQDAGGLPPNAALGMTMVTQDEVNQHAPTLAIAGAVLNPAFLFGSFEPLMEEIDLTNIPTMRFRGAEFYNALTGELRGMLGEPAGYARKIDWIIVGFESGANARVPLVRAAWSLRDQCEDTPAIFHFKQWGAWHPDAGAYTDAQGRCPPPRMKIGPKRSGRLVQGIVYDGRPEVRMAA